MRPRTRALFEDYQAYHRNDVNVAIHKFAVPAILFHVVAMLDWVPIGGGLTVGVAIVALASIWYVVMAPRYAAIVLPFAVLCLGLGRVTPAWAVVGVALVAWMAQLIGHARFERRAPAFTENFVQLLVGPAYVVALLLGDWPVSEE